MSSKEIDQKLIVCSHKKWENPKVTVIVPVYKVDKYLTQCLNSIVNQTMEELEIIIVDEGDQDRCREIIDYFESQDPRIIAPHQKNGGYGASCNLGIAMAKGEYIAIVESDDYIEPEMYEEMYAYAKALDADVVKTPYREYFNDGSKRECYYRTRIAQSVPQNICFSVKEYGELLEVHAALWSGIYRASYMHEKKIKFVEAKGGAYVDVGFRIDTLINTDKIAWLDIPYYNYRMENEGSTTNNFKLAEMLQRWTEAHMELHKKQEEYEKYYAKYLLIDEYLNTFIWIDRLLNEITEEEYRQMYDNFSYIPDEAITNTILLTEVQKRDIKEFKKDRYKYMNKAKRSVMVRNFSRIIMRFLNKFNNEIFLFWCFAGFLTAGMTGLTMSIVYQSYMISYVAYVFSTVFFFGMFVCFFCKFFRKILLCLKKHMIK